MCEFSLASSQRCSSIKEMHFQTRLESWRGGVPCPKHPTMRSKNMRERKRERKEREREKRERERERDRKREIERKREKERERARERERERKRERERERKREREREIVFVVFPCLPSLMVGVSQRHSTYSSPSLLYFSLLSFSLVCLSFLSLCPSLYLVVFLSVTSDCSTLGKVVPTFYTRGPETP